jgi:NADPH:quinone reductase-like Zn-dependent oxidoreductase
MTEIPAQMKAVRLHAPGGVDHLAFEEVNTPTPGAGEVLVKVHAAAITRDELEWPTDRLPAIPSYELSGTVVSVGDDVEEFLAGQAVYGLTGFDRDGVAAEYAAVPVAELSPKPERLSHVESAAIPLPALSAMQGLFDHGQLTKNQRVLVHGGAGGVGGFAVQLARIHGAYVMATTSKRRVEAARMLGADEVIDHTSTDFTTIQPVDLVFDTAGGDRLTRSVEVLKEGGRLVSVAERPPQGLTEHDVEGVFFVVEPNQEQLTELARYANQGAIQVLIDHTYPLTKASEAFEHLMNRGGRGKVVLTVAEAE